MGREREERILKKGGGYSMAVGRGGGEAWRRRKKRKEKKKIKILIYYYYYIDPKIRPVPNGVQKLQKIENIILRRNMKTV